MWPGMERAQARAEIIGLATRRLKWHAAEHNRILSEWSLIPDDQRPVAKRALEQHRAAVVECQAFARFEEPAWGNEREITEQFLWGPGQPGPQGVSGEHTDTKAVEIGFPSEPE